ncbi:hypothetical protein MTF66_05180 [Pseudoalteromonas sp. 2CM39R]|uniref:hypothetical protein n=1 Tax=Pseudoalteromonas sp. 2CM39R TaxID=2929856 RepID=UPI0020BDFEC3|nr:hypothetical protein [Pseudoalteromonas sp. 2CM39R]MCK8124380.1 hypothetical protein [Pseudoalteromonas sp. 2CM39R]
MLNKFWNWILDCIRIDEDIALHENRIFWIVVLIPFGFICWLFFSLTQDLISDGLYNPHVSSESLASFVNYYAFPITLLTIPLTLAVMINRFHSSKQKAKSNRLVEKNNVANNFFNHYKYFSEHCEAVNVRFESSVIAIKPEVLYKKMFPHSSINKNVNEVDISIIDEAFKSYVSNLYNFIKHEKKVGLNGVFSETNEYGEPTEGHKLFYLKENFFYTLEIPGLIVSTKISQEREIFIQIQNCHDLILMLVNFHGATNSIQLVNKLNTKFNEFTNKYFDERKEHITLNF